MKPSRAAWVREVVTSPDGCPLLLCGAVGVGIWMVFEPGVLFIDSLRHYREATLGQYGNWHPPIMSILLRGALKCGGDLGLLTLVQCLAGCLGLRAFVSASLRALYGDGLSEGQRAWLALAVFLLLLLPLSPLLFYLVTFWKDSWAMALLLWVGAGLLRLSEKGARPVAQDVATWLGLVGCMTLLLLVRHNAVVLAPLFPFCLVVLLRKRGLGLGWAVLAALAPVVCYPLARFTMQRAFVIREQHPEDQVLALDLVGLCVLDEGLRPSLPHTSAHLVEGAYREYYRFGWVGPLYGWVGPPIVKEEFVFNNHEGLKAEYLKAAREHPGALARVKWKAFESLLGAHSTNLWFQPGIHENEFGLEFNPEFGPVREALTRAGQSVVRDRHLRWVSGVHLVWVLANVAWLLGAGWAYKRFGAARFANLAVVLLLPLGYYLSYLAAVPARDFRFMYPSTLMIQALTAGALAGGALALANRRLARSGRRNAPVAHSMG
jgi:hypothetical protein